MPRPLTADRRPSRRAALAAIVAAPFGFARLASAEPRTVTAKRVAASGLKTAAGPMQAAIDAAARGERAAAALASYRTTLLKKEWIGGEVFESELRMKVRHNPFAVYLKYVEPHAGRQVLYRDGANAGQMLVRQTGLASLFGTMSVQPRSSLALKENRHPITSAGMQNLAANVATLWRDAARAEREPTVRRYPNARFAGYECEAFEVSHAGPGQHAAFAKSRLFLDLSTGLPVRLQRFDFDLAAARPAAASRLVEDYAYVELDLRTKLTARDFDPANPAYGFE